MLEHGHANSPKDGRWCHSGVQNCINKKKTAHTQWPSCSLECVPGAILTSTWIAIETRVCLCQHFSGISFLHLTTFAYILTHCIHIAHRSTFKRIGNERLSFSLMHNPMSFAMLQCGTVGVNKIFTRSRLLSTLMSSNRTTFNCSSVSGCSGSLRWRMWSKTSNLSNGSTSASSQSDCKTSRREILTQEWIVGLAFCLTSKFMLYAALRRRIKNFWQWEISWY